jgi:amino acid transporter
MFNRTAALYYALAVVGLVATWYFILQFFAGGGSLAPSSFFPAVLANSLSTSITIDIYLSGLVFSIWAILERGHVGSPKPWLYIILCFCIGLAFAFPLYLGRRAQLRAQQDRSR